MMVPVRCISCGRPIGQYWEVLKKRMAEGESSKAVLDSLGVTNYCCRSALLTQVDTLQQIGKFKH